MNGPNWPRFWAVDIYTDTPLKQATITVGKLARQEPAKNDVTITYLCMCGISYTRVMGTSNEECEAWVQEHRAHNHKAILDIIPEKLRPGSCKDLPES